jgi:hypothetical protein
MWPVIGIVKPLVHLLALDVCVVGRLNWTGNKVRADAFRSRGPLLSLRRKRTSATSFGASAPSADFQPKARRSSAPEETTICGPSAAFRLVVWFAHVAILLLYIKICTNDIILNSVIYADLVLNSGCNHKDNRYRV